MSSSIEPLGLSRAARTLLRTLIQGYDSEHGFGAMSCAVYDTAWVALVSKNIEDNGRQWLFPECFQYILATQADDGSWPAGIMQIDSILNTAVSLLAIRRHMREPLQLTNYSLDDLTVRASKAYTSLQALLEDWDVSSCFHVGFEIIVPALLEYLEEEGYTFSFDDRQELTKLNTEKLSKFKPEYLYGKTKLTALHSLESLIGKVDFNKVAHHKVGGALMASPSSTAAYLMHISGWDNEAEEYLRHVVSVKRHIGGGVPSAYPSTYFEYTWVLSTLFKAGFTSVDLEGSDLSELKNILCNAFKEENGAIGFAPFLGADVDDTAKGLLCLGMLGTPAEHGVNVMIDKFETKTHFRTYPEERDPSFTANCNALMALLHEPDPTRYSPQIFKIVSFLVSYWWDNDGVIGDKWNLSSHYTSMLLVEGFTSLLNLLDQGLLVKELDEELKWRMLITLTQACLRTMLNQDENGSWSDSVEQTSYGILILSEASRLSFFKDAREHLRLAIDKAVGYIQSWSYRSSRPEYVWIEKVTYGSSVLTEGYRLAALKSAYECRHSGEIGSNLGIEIARPMMEQYVKLFQQTPMFKESSLWKVRCSFLESSFFQPLLRRRRLSIFPRKHMEDDKYFDMIPFIWTLCNNYKTTFASTTYMFEMMIISFLNFQADEYMEGVAGPAFAGELHLLHKLIDDVFAKNFLPISNRRSRIKNGDNIPNGRVNGLIDSRSQTTEVEEQLKRFVSHVLERTDVLGASAWDQRQLIQELRIYLHAHTTQAEDNEYLTESNDGLNQSQDQFFTWVRTTASNHTSAPYSFALIACMLSSTLCKGEHCFPTAASKFFGSDMSRHLSAMCRMYNDYGSVQRDAAEKNLNSLNFREFNTNDATQEDKKKELMKLGEYERCCLNEAINHLDAEADTCKSSRSRRLEKRKMEIWGVLVDVTDLHGQIYVVRDIASKKRTQQKPPVKVQHASATEFSVGNELGRMIKSASESHLNSVIEMSNGVKRSNLVAQDGVSEEGNKRHCQAAWHPLASEEFVVMTSTTV